MVNDCWIQTPFKRILPPLLLKVTNTFKRSVHSTALFLSCENHKYPGSHINSIFDVELNGLLTLYKSLIKEIDTLKKENNRLIEEVHPHYMFVPGIGPISAALIYSEYGDISNFSTPAQMLTFAGIEPGINDSGTESHGGRMVKHGSSQLRYVLINCCLPLIRFDMTFAAYYAQKRGEGKPHRVAVIHVAKKLVRVIYALERQGEDFNAQKLR